MSFAPVRPAQIDFSDPAAPQSIDGGDTYPARHLALQQAQHVYLRGSGLPRRWAGRARFTVLETGFGLGDNFLATWQAWRDDPQRCTQLWFIAVERHPPSAADLARAHQGSHLPGLAQQLRERWPPATPDLHRVDFDAGRVHLLLLWADLRRALPEIVAQVDAFYLGGLAPSLNATMWDDSALRRLHRLAAPASSLATSSVDAPVHAALRTAGFELNLAPGFAHAPHMTIGRFVPRQLPSLPPGRLPRGGGDALVVGAGLAGAAVAHALAAQGMTVTVLDQHDQPSQEASGNPAGLYHGIVHGQDGPHARWLRAASLWAHAQYQPWVAQGLIEGQAAGLLRAERELDLMGMRRLLERQKLPADWVQALDLDEARVRSGTTWRAPAWYYPRAGWVSPPMLVRHCLGRSGIEWRGGRRVARLRALGEQWQALAEDGTVLASAGCLILANSAQAMSLLAPVLGAGFADVFHTPTAWLQTTRQPAWRMSRGQISLWSRARRVLPLPIAGNGYALSLPKSGAMSGGLMFGASAQWDDDEPQPRDSDHIENLAILGRLTGWRAAPRDATRALLGRVGWRMQTPDRLPWLGPVPTPQVSDSARSDQARFIARVPGLYLFTGLGARGLTHAPLAAELLASWITGAPMSAPASLVDALDVARLSVKAAVHAQRLRLNQS